MITQTLAQLNDAFRQTFNGGKVMLTPGIIALPDLTRNIILHRVSQFNDFTSDNDPYGEHDFGTLDCHGQRIFWKIDYYDTTMTYGSEHPEDPEQTTRVLTIMLADEY